MSTIQRTPKSLWKALLIAGLSTITITAAQQCQFSHTIELHGTAPTQGA